jgi:hemerythrin
MLGFRPMPIAWTPKLAVGVPLLDAQHQELFRRIAALLEAMASGRGRAHLVETLRFLDSYVEEHFSAEVAMMREAGYPLLHSHLGAHAHFVSELDKIRRQIGHDEIEARLVIRAGGLLCDWLREHIASSDRDFGSYLAERGMPESAGPGRTDVAEAPLADDGQPAPPRAG